MSRELRNLEVKSGRGLLGRGRSGSNHSSIFAGMARSYLRGHERGLVRQANRQADMHDRMANTVSRLQLRATTDANGKRRRMARVALYDGAGAAHQLRRQRGRLDRTVRRLNGTRRALAHFGG